VVQFMVWITRAPIAAKEEGFEATSWWKGHPSHHSLVDRQDETVSKLEIREGAVWVV
jgi:hypothetical protein